MADISKITIETSSGRIISLKLDDLSNPLKKKLRKETEKFLMVKQVINEPMYNEGVNK